MRIVYTASVTVDGLKVERKCRDDEEASMWIRLMTAQYLGRVSSPTVTCTAYSEIFHAPMTIHPGQRGGSRENIGHLHGVHAR